MALFGEGFIKSTYRELKGSIELNNPHFRIILRYFTKFYGWGIIIPYSSFVNGGVFMLKKWPIV